MSLTSVNMQLRTSVHFVVSLRNFVVSLRIPVTFNVRLRVPVGCNVQLGILMCFNVQLWMPVHFNIKLGCLYILMLS